MTLGGPRHIAFIMDGNGRWARAQGLPRIRGHERGADVLRSITRHCTAIGIPEVTFYALSTENYRRRPRDEVRDLLDLLCRYLVSERNEIRENGIRFRTIGRVEELPPHILEEVRRTEELSRENRGMILRLALNYGSRTEILDAVSRLMDDVRAGVRPDTAGLTEEEFARYLYDPEMEDPDLLVRTAGEMRISNFLLWQLSYTELWIAPEPWPEFSPQRLDEAIAAYESRNRKFGDVPRAAVSQEEDLD